MKIKKKYIILTSVLLIVIGTVFELVHKYQEGINNKPQLNINTNNNTNITDKQLEMIETLVGLQSKNMKVLDNPLRIEGNFVVPEKTVLKLIKYYLQTSKNNEIQNLNVSIDNHSIKVSAKYRVFNTFNAPIEISIIPSITIDSNIKLHIEDIKFVGVSINEDIIDALIKSWFSDMKYITVDKRDIIIDKNNFNNIIVKDISINSNNLVVDIIMKLQ